MRLKIPLVLVSWFAALPLLAADYRFFDQEVLPILEERCYRCHGGEEKLKGDLRLTSREGLLHGGELGPSFDADNPGESFFLEAIRYENDEYQMPPKGKLPEAELQVLTRWIEEGALYNPEKEIKGALVEEKNHIREEDFSYWAYRPVHRPDLKSLSAGRNPIDVLLDRSRKSELEVNGRASRATLIRRATYDLTGLPPTPAEVSRFVEDPRPDEEVWNELIEDLLDRPQYGEKWARHWLDLVRYAESNGFERDNPKPHIWQYRDYVVRAFNEDKPYDQFIREQLAGDELENPSFDTMAATGFYRLMQWDDEPADRKQHVYDVLADNVAIVGETFLGSTLGCARCHDHKADPFTQKDYYSFMAFFHGVTSYKTEGTLVPWAAPEELASFETERKAKLAAWNQELAQTEQNLEQWLKEQGYLRAKGATERSGITLVRNALAESVKWAYTFTPPSQDWNSVGFRNKSWSHTDRGGFGRPGMPGTVVNNKWDTPDIWMRTTFGLKELPASLYLEIRHEEEVEVYLNGVEIYRAKGALNQYESIPLGKKALDALQTGRNSLAIHCRQSGGGQYVDAALTSQPQSSTLIEALRRGGKKLAREVEDALGQDLVQKRLTLRQQIEQWRKKVPGIPLNAVTEYGPAPQPLHVHIRGSVHAPGEEVEPAFPAVLHGQFEPFPAVVPASYRTEKSSGRRRALAEWIASPENPLTARVMVNRLWQHHFGRGLVASSSDFGTLGETPTHPELLDWLASEFIHRDWSLKSMHRLILNSEAYQRSSAPSETSLETDPGNHFYWRANMRRLTAEEIRDSILQVSGNLNAEIGGPWVTPPLPAAVLATASRPGKNWPVAQGDDAFRRSLYIHVKRSLREPMLASHDQADTDGHCAVRFATTVPTQALGMMNSEFTNRQARVFAENLRDAAPDLESRVELGLALALQRTPGTEEVAQMAAMQRELAATGLSPQEALERFALLTFNLNEFIYLD